MVPRFGAEESKAAFIRARALAAAIDDATERFTIYYGLWNGNMVRGELGFAREIAEAFLREAERAVRTTECGVGRRLLGVTCLWHGDFIEAQANLVEALSIYDPERDRKARFRFDPDTGAAARVYLAIAKWQLGEVGPARALIGEAVAQAIATGHVPTLVNNYCFKAEFEMVRGELELPGATRKLPSNSANPPGQALGWTATRPERRSFDGHWRRTPTKEANCLCRSSKLCLPRSRRKTSQREP